MNDPVRFGVKEGVATLTFDDGARMNPPTPALLAGALDALARVRADPAIRVLVLAANGKGFCVGADLAAFQGAEDSVRRTAMRSRRCWTPAATRSSAACASCRVRCCARCRGRWPAAVSASRSPPTS